MGEEGRDTLKVFNFFKVADKWNWIRLWQSKASSWLSNQAIDLLYPMKSSPRDVTMPSPSLCRYCSSPY